MKNENTNSYRGPAPYDDPIAASASMARRIAPQLCRKDPCTGTDCSWYHGLWQYLRALDIVTTPADHAQFFHDTFQSLVRAGGYTRVLVSGSADYSMAAQVLWAYQQENANIDLLIVDRCETPLYLTRWYAKRISATVGTVRSDILDFDAAEPFDVICTHSFMGYFTPTKRRDLIATWHRLLRPGGKLVTINRVRPSTAEDTVRFTPEQAETFRERVFRQALQAAEFLDLDAETLAGWAQIYTERFRIHPVKSREEIVNLFEEGGFTLEHLDTAYVANEKVDQRPSGPTAPGYAEYAHIIASRT